MSGAAASAVLTSPAAARNREPILQVLRSRLAAKVRVLEIASGSGEHAVWFAQGLPGVSWLPSDHDPAALASIAARRAQAGLDNLQDPLRIDASAPDAWPAIAVDAVVCLNMIHIAPWGAAEGMMAGAGRILAPGGLLVLYGPFREGGRHTAPSNAAFDESLRSRDPAWGVRDLDDVRVLAASSGLRLAERIAMPANNLTLIFERC